MPAGPDDKWPLPYKVFIVRTSFGPFIVHAPFAIGMVATMVEAGFEVVIAKLFGRDKSRRRVPDAPRRRCRHASETAPAENPYARPTRPAAGHVAVA